MQSNLRAQAEIQAQRKKVSRARHAAPARPRMSAASRSLLCDTARICCALALRLRFSSLRTRISSYSSKTPPGVLLPWTEGAEANGATVNSPRPTSRQWETILWETL